MAPKSEKNALVIGKGSIGLRHADVLSLLGYSVLFVSRRASSGGVDYAKTLDALKAKNFDRIVLATETGRHSGDLLEIVKGGFLGNVLVEKPIFKSSSDAESFSKTDAIFVGYNMRFNPLVKKLHEKINGQKILSIQAYVGQNLNDWRKNRKGVETYSGLKSAGGGVLRDLSHELDLVNWLVGPLELRGASGGRLGDVTVDSEDYVTCTFSGRNGAAIGVTLSYLDHQTTRTMIVNTDKHTFKIDFISGEFWEDQVCEKIPFERNESYVAMHRALDENRRDVICDWKQGLSVLQLIEAIERKIGSAGK